jgi:cbb3-type cytochrome oxidase subunit 3
MMEEGAAIGSLVLLIFVMLIYLVRPWLYWPGRR